MPLPDRNVEWPPPSQNEAAKLYTEWGAWYSGDPQRLAAVYQTTAGFDLAGMGEAPKGQPLAPRFMAGLRRGVQRRFWGHTGSSEQVIGNKLHIPLASDIATTSADLMFGEELEITVDDDEGKPHKATVDRLDEIHEEANAQSVWLEAAEIASAYGGAYVRVGWDPLIAECPLYDALPPDSAVPVWRGGRLAAVTFWRYLERIDGRIWRHLEHHEPGRVRHGVYVSGDDAKLGRPMSLKDHPETTAFAALVESDGQTVQTGAKGLAVDYLPNIRPNRMLRGSPLGRSDFQGVEPIFDALDETWSSWLRDLRLGKGRIVVPRSYVQSLGRGRGGVFDADKEVYEAVDAITNPEGGLAISNIQFAIRVDEHSRTARELTRKAIESAGYSAQTFGEVDTVAATATEVIARQERTYRTRGKKILYARGTVARVDQAALEIDAVKFGTKGTLTGKRPSVKFPDGVATDREALARTLQMLQAAETASIYTRVKMFNPDWDEPEIMREVDRIKEESGKGTVPPPGSGDGGTPGQGPDGPINISGDPTSPMPPGPNGGQQQPADGRQPAAAAASSGTPSKPPVKATPGQRPPLPPRNGSNGKPRPTR